MGNTLGKNIRRIRKEKGLTANELGDRVGLTPQAILQYERGERIPNFEVALKIARALNTPINAFIDRDEKINRTRGFEIVDDKYRKHPEIEINYPIRGTEFAMAYDFFANETVTIMPGEQHLFATDIKAYMGYEECLVGNVRSSQGSEKNLSFANSQAWIDSDYYNNEKTGGNIGICLYNYGKKPQIIKQGERIAQFAFLPHLVADNCNTNKKRNGGFGSTGE